MLLEKIENLAKDFKAAFSRFSIALILSYIATFLAIYQVELSTQSSTINKVIFVLIPTIIAFIVARLFAKSYSKYKLLSCIVAALFGVAYYLSLDNIKTFVSVFREVFIIIGLISAIYWAPFVGKKVENIHFWEWAKRVTLSFISAFLFTIVLTIGFYIALKAINTLFGVKTHYDTYLQVNIFLIGFFGVTYFLSQLPKEPLLVEPNLPIKSIESFFIKWILTPLSIVYFAILYAYSAKVLALGIWPKGLIAWLVTLFSFFAILTYLFWTHLADKNSKFRRYIWLAILLQTFMLFSAIYMRISQYSITESRYMVLLLGIWLFLISLYFLLFKNAKIKYIFVSLTLIILLSQFGPLSAYSVSQKAQTAILNKLLRKYKNSNKLSESETYRFSNILRYLYSRYELKAVQKLFPKICNEYAKNKKKLKEIDKKLSKYKHPNNAPKELVKQRAALSMKAYYLPNLITDTLGIKYTTKWNKKGYSRKDFYLKSFGQSYYKIEGYNYLIVLNRYKLYSNQTVRIGKTKVYLDNNMLNIEQDNIKTKYNIEQIFNTLASNKSLPTLDKEELIFTNANSKIVFKHLTKTTRDGKVNYEIDAVLLIK